GRALRLALGKRRGRSEGQQQGGRRERGGGGGAAQCGAVHPHPSSASICTSSKEGPAPITTSITAMSSIGAAKFAQYACVSPEASSTAACLLFHIVGPS